MAGSIRKRIASDNYRALRRAHTPATLSLTLWRHANNNPDSNLPTTTFVWSMNSLFNIRVNPPVTMKFN